jgi:hypothetical protein
MDSPEGESTRVSWVLPVLDELVQYSANVVLLRVPYRAT